MKRGRRDRWALALGGAGLAIALAGALVAYLARVKWDAAVAAVERARQERVAVAPRSPAGASAPAMAAAPPTAVQALAAIDERRVQADASPATSEAPPLDRVALVEHLARVRGQRRREPLAMPARLPEALAASPENS